MHLNSGVREQEKQFRGAQQKPRNAGFWWPVGVVSMQLLPNGLLVPQARIWLGVALDQD